jgi:hypothetical protein
MAVTGNIHAVLTGDLVSSSRLTSSQSQQAMELLRTSASRFERCFPCATCGSMDTFRHDSWQLLLNRPEQALRAALFLRTALRMESDAITKYDTRISIGIGTAEYIATERISNSRGPAFTLSGRGVDTMKTSSLALSIATEDTESWNDMIHAVIPLLDSIVTDWTPTESRAVNAALTGLTQEEIAAQWMSKKNTPPTRQAICDSLLRAHWKSVHSVLLLAEKKMQKEEIRAKKQIL